MHRWKLKGCPRCRGDIYMEKEHDNWHEQCLQCGYVRYQPVCGGEDLLGRKEVVHSVTERGQAVTAGR